MIATAILIGFFSAVGWWGGNKATAAVDAVLTPAVACPVEVRHE